MKMRKPCARDGNEEGRIETRGGQDCVYCTACGLHQYNAPKTETGRAVRSVQTLHAGISPKMRARILLRATGRCELCGSKPTTEHPLNVGHLVSVAEGIKRDLTDQEINHEENLCAMCDACNLGIGKEVVPIRLLISMLLARIKLKTTSD